MTRFTDPRDLRTALQAHQYNWNAILTLEQMALQLPAEDWGGCVTLREWLADGGYTETGANYASRAVCRLLQDADAKMAGRQ